MGSGVISPGESPPSPAKGASLPPPAVGLARRNFLALLPGCLLCGSAALQPARAATDRPIDIGTLADFPRDEISEKFIPFDVFVVRHEGRLFALGALCPHKANYLLRDPQDAGRIICSGHESTFNPEGTPTHGPARRALVRYAIAVNDRGRVMVDTSREFPQAQWQDKSSYLVVK